MDFASDAEFTGGPAVYRDEVEGLAAQLRRSRVAAEVLTVPVEGLPASDLARYKALYLVDTYAIMPPAREALEQYVRGGGVVVGICEVGRFPGDWARPWPFGAMFGLDTKPIDEWGTGVSMRNDGFYTQARNLDPHSPLMAGLGASLDFGVEAVQAWVTTPTGAEVVAEFSEPGAEPVPAVTLNRYGRGAAVFFATLPTGRRLSGWTNSADSVRVLANALAMATNSIAVPQHNFCDDVVVGRNQAGYEPNGPKRVVFRLPATTGAVATCSFVLADAGGKAVRSGNVPVSTQTLWKSRFATVDFSEVREPGAYKLQAFFSNPGCAVTATVRIARDILSGEVVPLEAGFFRSMRCGELCHERDPVTGGYHDATGDYSVRMWSMPHVVWCLARAAEHEPAGGAVAAELDHAADWCLRMQDPDGSVYAGVSPPQGGWSPASITNSPSRDPAQRVVEKRYSFQYTATYAAALARAAAVKAGRGQSAWEERLHHAAEKAFDRIKNEKVEATGDLGDRAWAALELYRLGRNPDYLARARADVEAYLPRQLEQGRVAGADLYGNFFADAARTTFDPQQWKIFHNLGIYLGLIELARQLPPDDRLRPSVEMALRDFTDGYLLGMATVSPYGQFANGLEPRVDGTFVVQAFADRTSWVRGHGMNCDILAMATVALERYRDTKDTRLRDMALRQLDWIMGDNPLGLSMVEGVGDRVAPGPDPTLGTGPIRGGIFNGITGRGSANLPMWGYSWDSREYWLPQNAYLLSTIALLRDEEQAAGGE